MKPFYAFFLVLLLAATGCRQGRAVSAIENGDTIRMKYAENIVITRSSALTMVELRNPWGEGVLHRYWLVPVGAEGDFSDLEGTLVHVPLRRSVVFNTAHASLLLMLRADSAMAGVADAKYMLLPEVQRRLREGNLVDCGDAMAPDIEKIVDLQADAILLSPFENSGGYGGLEKLGVPLIECAEYMETSALGRAEWMRFYGILFGCEAQADSLFEEVERAYFGMRDEGVGMRDEGIGMKDEGIGMKDFSGSGERGARLSMLTERLTGSTWYVAGGRSSVGRLIADAGGRYAWADDNHSGSLPLSFETVLDKAGDADVWIFNYTGAMPLSRRKLSSEHHGYEAFKAFQTGEIYYVNSLQVPYFEEVSFRPDWLLRDYVILLHPEHHHRDTLRYFKKIEP